jgi:hypothetical protein
MTAGRSLAAAVPARPCALSRGDSSISMLRKVTALPSGDLARQGCAIRVCHIGGLLLRHHVFASSKSDCSIGLLFPVQYARVSHGMSVASPHANLGVRRYIIM